MSAVLPYIPGPVPEPEPEPQEAKPLASLDWAAIAAGRDLYYARRSALERTAKREVQKRNRTRRDHGKA